MGGGGGGGGNGSSSTVRIIGKEVVILKFCFLVLEVWVFKFQGPRILGERERAFCLVANHFLSLPVGSVHFRIFGESLEEVFRY